MTTTLPPKQRKPLPDHGTYARANGRPTQGIPPCQCPPCRLEARRYLKRRNYLIAKGQTLKVPADRAQAHLRALRQAGITWVQLENEAGLKVDTLLAVERGQRALIWRTTEQRILAAHPEPSPEALVPALGSTRRLRALMTDGHRMTDVAAYGINVDTLASLVNGKSSSIRLATARIIAHAYTELSRTPGTYERNRNRGTAAGWPGSAAWHPDDLDAPDAEPDPDHIDPIAVQRAIDGEPVELTRAERMEVTRLLTLDGATARRIAKQIGVTERTVTRWRVAAGWKAAA